MNYLLKNNRLYKFDENIIIEKPYYANEIEVCIDESGFALFDKLNKDKAKIEDNLLKVGKTKIKTFEYNLPNFNYNFDNEFEIDLNIIKEASKFTDKKMIKEILTGIYINEKGTVIATDIFKIYYYDKGKSNNYVILSPQLVGELIKHNGDSIIKFNKSNAQIICNDGSTITGRLIIGQFPDLTQLLKISGECYNLSSNEFKKAIEIGKLVNGNINVLIGDNQITFEGDNEYTEDFNANFKTYITLDLLNTAINVFNNEFELYYQGEVKPLYLRKDNKMVVVFTMRRLGKENN